MKHIPTLHGVSSSLTSLSLQPAFTSRADIDKPPFEVTETGCARNVVLFLCSSHLPRLIDGASLRFK